LLRVLNFYGKPIVHLEINLVNKDKIQSSINSKS